MANKTKYITYLFFIIALIINISFWLYSKDIKSQWANVPPPPETRKASMMALSDSQLAYRSYNTMLQNIGSSGGEVQALKDYNYAMLEKWFFLLDSLDPRAEVTPYLVSFYFSAVQDVEKLNYLFDYLEMVGSRDFGNKWRWLGHGVYLARHKLKDNDKALEMAYTLAGNENPNIGAWAKQMPAIIQQSEGNSEEAYKIMINLIQDNAETMHPVEINFMVDYVCNTILEENKSLQKPEFCDNV